MFASSVIICCSGFLFFFVSGSSDRDNTQHKKTNLNTKCYVVIIVAVIVVVVVVVVGFIHLKPFRPQKPISDAFWRSARVFVFEWSSKWYSFMVSVPFGSILAKIFNFAEIQLV